MSLFNHILVINLDRDIKRMERIYAQAETLNLSDKINRVQGIYGKDLPSEEIKKYKLSNPGVIGCALSHRKAWQTIVDQNLENALIIEDDITFTSLVGKILVGNMNISIPMDWDVVYLGHSKNHWPRNACSRIPQPGYDIGGKKGPVEISPHVIKFIDTSEAPMGGYAYVLSHKAAKWCLENYKMSEPNDTFMSSQNVLNQLNIYGIIPTPITHCYEFGSNTWIPSKENFVFQGTSSKIYIWCIIFFVIACAIYLIPTRYCSNVWKISSLSGFVILLLILCTVSKKDNQQEKMTYDHYTQKYGPLPGIFGEHYFDPFADVWISPHKERAIQLLNYLSLKCREQNIPVILMYGTLLGWARHSRKLIPWDDDMDVTISEEYKNQILKMIKDDPNLGWVEGLPYIYDIKIWFKSPDYSEEIVGYTQRWPFIDIYFYSKNGGLWLREEDNERKSVIPLPVTFKEDTFEGVDIYVPTEYRKILNVVYGKNWQTDCVSSSFCHRTEKSIDPRYQSKQLCHEL